MQQQPRAGEASSTFGCLAEEMLFFLMVCDPASLPVQWKPLHHLFTVFEKGRVRNMVLKLTQSYGKERFPGKELCSNHCPN